MNTRELSKSEQFVLLRFREVSSDYALIFLTKTGLTKSILDATTPVRTLLKTNDFHDFACQAQGPSNKRILPVHYLENDKTFVVEASLYRPVTKDGDPRIWFSRLTQHARPNDVLVFFVAKRELFLANLTRLSVSSGIGLATGTWLECWLNQRRLETFSIANELLAKLKKLAAKGPIVSDCQGDTAVGRAIETALGIAMNSRMLPDYKGIEIKAKRIGSTGTRATLFAQVPNWTLSGCKSSKEILDLIGYQRDDVDKLYCTVSSLKPNSQGLQFRLLKEIDHLVEYTRSHANVAVWELGKLHERLLQKHPETFWIRVASERRANAELFTLVEAAHTRQPSVARFDEFLEQGIITMDHLIKRSGGRVSEKGPLFKIWPSHLDDLFLSTTTRYPLN